MTLTWVNGGYFGEMLPPIFLEASLNSGYILQMTTLMFFVIVLLHM